MHVNVPLEPLRALTPIQHATDALRQTSGLYDFEAQLQSGLAAAQLQQQELALHEVLCLVMASDLYNVLVGCIHIE